MLNNLIFKIQKTTSKNPKNDAVLLALKSETYKQKRKFKQALNLLTKAIIFDNQNDTFYYSRAVVYLYAKKYNLALKDIEKAIKINSKIYYYYLVKADIYFQQNKEEEELKNIKAAFELMPKADRYYSYKIEKHHRNPNSFLPDFYQNRDKIIKEKYNNLAQ